MAASNDNATGGYLNRGAREYLVRSIGRLQGVEDIENVVVKADSERPVLLRQVARVVEAPQVRRGDSAVNGAPAVMLTIAKQPGADTRLLTDQITEALEELKASLPPDIRINPEVYQQKAFIELGIHNVIDALRDGSILVVIILFLFLLNFRTTFITLTAIPLSIVVTGLVFKWFDMSINTMTLGRPGRRHRRTGGRRHRGRGKRLSPAAREQAFRQSQARSARGLRSQQRSAQFDRLQHDPRGARVRPAVRAERHGRPPVHALGSGLHRLDPCLARGVADSHANIYGRTASNPINDLAAAVGEYVPD